MRTSDFIVLAFDAVGGRITGKTKLQKTMYFLGLLCERLDELGYRPHFYGPYSAEVAAAVNRLRMIGVLNQEADVWGIDRSGFEVRRFEFELTEKGRAFVERKKKDNADLCEQISSATETLNRAGDIDYMSMSLAAKTYFLLDGAQPITLARLAQKATRFGWQVSKEQIERAAQYLAKLDLVELVDPDG